MTNLEYLKQTLSINDRCTQLTACDVCWKWHGDKEKPNYGKCPTKAQHCVRILELLEWLEQEHEAKE